MNLKIKKTRIFKGFTLAEMLIVLAILGVIGSIIISSLDLTLPNKNKAKFRKAYNTIYQTVQYLTNDATLYPLGTFDTNTAGNQAAASYFCQNFSEQLSTTSSINCVSSAAASTKNADTYANSVGSVTDGYCSDAKRTETGAKKYAFRTADNIIWYGMNYNFASDKTNYMIMCVDVNPDDTSDLEHIYSFGIRYDGRIAPGIRAQDNLYEEN